MHSHTLVSVPTMCKDWHTHCMSSHQLTHLSVLTMLPGSGYGRGSELQHYIWLSLRVGWSRFCTGVHTAYSEVYVVLRFSRTWSLHSNQCASRHLRYFSQCGGIITAMVASYHILRVAASNSFGCRHLSQYCLV